MISVEEAIARLTAVDHLIGSERVTLTHAHRRVLAADAIAQITQPPASVSAMDGYAVRLADAQRAPVALRVIGASPAGHPFAGRIGAGEAVRIFTGGVVPAGADGIVIQENASCDGETVTLREAATSRHIRSAGLDFRQGAVLAPAGRRLGARDLALLAAGDLANVEVRPRPVVAIAATGDELAPPGAPRRPGGIVASTGYALMALIENWGGTPLDLGIVADTMEAFGRIPDASAPADVIVTIGGASVGDHDLVQRALARNGLSVDFWKVAMRPGKPLIFGRLKEKPFLGLPGNPVSSYVCALLFLQPLIAKLLGVEFQLPRDRARLSRPLPANDVRQDHLRARLFRRDGELWVDPLELQDSSLQSALAAADAIVVRAPHAPPASAGDTVDLILLRD